MAENFTKLLKAIADVMYQTTDAVNPFWSLSEALSRLLNMKQSTDESVYAYKDRMLQEASVVKGKIGTDFAKQFVKKTEKYANQSDAAEQKKMENNAYDKFVATCYLRGCDQERYQSLI